MSDRVTLLQTEQIAQRLRVNHAVVPLAELRRGMLVELEHGTLNLQDPTGPRDAYAFVADSITNLTNDDLMDTAKIALAHFAKGPSYYEKLDAMESGLKKARIFTEGASPVFLAPPDMWKLPIRTTMTLLNIDMTVISPETFLKGIAVEMEHGIRNARNMLQQTSIDSFAQLGGAISADGLTNITHDSKFKSAQIALAHLGEGWNYYDLLESKVEIPLAAERKQLNIPFWNVFLPPDICGRWIWTDV